MALVGLVVWNAWLPVIGSCTLLWVCSKSRYHGISILDLRALVSLSFEWSVFDHPTDKVNFL